MYLKRGMEAANNSLMKNDGLAREWVGKDDKVVIWRGYYEDGRITSFFPE